jgi:predicted ATP-grasp superfamily ATP-dependent carboligase
VKPPHTAAIVLGTEVNGIAVIRSLGRLGVRCAAIRTPSRNDFAIHSRYLSFSHEVPAGSTDDALLIAISEAALRLGNQDPVVLIPTTDRFSEFLSRNAPSLAPRFVACCPSRPVCDAFLDKWKTALLCTQQGVRIPRTLCPKSPEEVAAAADELRYPVIIKPRYTYGTNFPGKNAVVRSGAELIEFFRKPGLIEKSIAQEIIPSGDGDILVTASYSGRDGRVKAIYSGRKIRQFLPDYGATCFGISERHADLEVRSRAFLDGLGYTGFAALEFARSRADGLAYFLELNTRTYYHNQLFADAGVDLTQVAYFEAAGIDVGPMVQSLKQRDGVIWLDFRRDFQSMRIKRRQGRITVGAWLASLCRARSFAIWHPKDPRPFIVACSRRLADIAFRRARPAAGQPG